MRRREFVALVGGVAAWPLGLRAQQHGKIARIGFLALGSERSHAPRVAAFRAGLRDLGWVEGKSVAIEFRWADGNYNELPNLLHELIGLKIDVLVTHGTAGALAARRATATRPIVITAVSDMLTLGLVPSLARPGGNLTGLSFFTAELTAKRLELVKEAIPSLIKAAILLNPDNASSPYALKETEATARHLKIDLQPYYARRPDDLESIFVKMIEQEIGAVVAFEDTMLNANSNAIASLAHTKRLPLSGFPELVRAGGLVAYGVNLPETDYRAATFVDKILKGAKPADLPVERWSKFNIIINLRTAKALGLDLPLTLLARADEVIE